MAQSVCLAKLGLFRINFVTGTSQAGNSYEFFALERSFKKDGEDKWESERIILRPGEMCAVADMLKFSAERIMKKQATENDARRQSAQDNISDDVPF